MVESPVPNEASRNRQLPRAACALAAVAVSLSSFALLLGAFEQRSPARWLQPTPQVMELVARCDTLEARALREQCKVDGVAALAQPPRASEVRFAAR